MWISAGDGTSLRGGGQGCGLQRELGRAESGGGMHSRVGEERTWHSLRTITNLVQPERAWGAGRAYERCGGEVGRGWAREGWAWASGFSQNARIVFQRWKQRGGQEAVSVNQKRVCEKLNVGKQNPSLDSGVRPPLCVLLCDPEQGPQPLGASSLTCEMGVQVVPPPLGCL